MGLKRLNKEYKLDICNHINVKYGSINKDNPQVIYVSGKCWVSPQSEVCECKDIIDHVEKQMRKNIKLFLIDKVNFEDKFILDFDINGDNMLVGTKKFLSFDFYLRQNEKNKKTLKELKPLLSYRLSTVVNNVVYQFNKHNFTVEKKKYSRQ